MLNVQLLYLSVTPHCNYTHVMFGITLCSFRGFAWREKERKREGLEIFHTTLVTFDTTLGCIRRFTWLNCFLLAYESTPLCSH